MKKTFRLVTVTLVGMLLAVLFPAVTPAAEAAQKPRLVSPAGGSTVACGSVKFSWSGPNGGQYRFKAGTTKSGTVYANKIVGGSKSFTVDSLPSDGSKIVVRIAHRVNNKAKWNEKTFNVTACSKPKLVSPAGGSTVACGAVKFSWQGPNGGQYRFKAGTTKSGTVYANKIVGGSKSFTVDSLPSDGSKIVVRIAHRVNNKAKWNEKTFNVTACSKPVAPPSQVALSWPVDVEIGGSHSLVNFVVDPRGIELAAISFTVDFGGGARPTGCPVVSNGQCFVDGSSIRFAIYRANGHWSAPFNVGHVRLTSIPTSKSVSITAVADSTGQSVRPMVDRPEQAVRSDQTGNNHQAPTVVSFPNPVQAGAWVGFNWDPVPNAVEGYKYRIFETNLTGDTTYTSQTLTVEHGTRAAFKTVTFARESTHVCIEVKVDGSFASGKYQSPYARACSQIRYERGSGDTNCDGKTAVDDALLVAKHSVGAGSASCIGNGDRNGDGKTDIVDALIITRCSVGIETPSCFNLEARVAAMDRIRTIADTAQDRELGGTGHPDGIATYLDLLAIADNLNGYYSPQNQSDAQSVLEALNWDQDSCEKLVLWCVNELQPFDVVHIGLDVIGFVPGIGNIADGANVSLYLAQGNYIDAAISALAMIPAIGLGAVAALRSTAASIRKTGTIGSFEQALDFFRKNSPEVKKAIPEAPNSTQIFRAVEPDELADLRNAGVYRAGGPHAEWLDGKRFWLSQADADAYVALATKADLGGPYCVTSGCIPNSVLDQIQVVTMDGMDAVFLPNDLLPLIDDLNLPSPP